MEPQGFQVCLAKILGEADFWHWFVHALHANINSQYLEPKSFGIDMPRDSNVSGHQGLVAFLVHQQNQVFTLYSILQHRVHID